MKKKNNNSVFIEGSNQEIEHGTEFNNQEILIVAFSGILAFSIFLIINNAFISPVLSLKYVTTLRGGSSSIRERIKTGVTEGIQNTGTKERVPYKKYDYRPKRVVKQKKRFLNQEEVVAIVKTHFDGQNTNLLSEVLTKTPQNVEPWQFVLHSKEVEKLVEKNLPISIPNRIDEKLSLTLFLKIYVVHVIRRCILLRGGKLKSQTLLITQEQAKEEKISQKKRDISLIINKKVFFFVTFGLIVLLILVVYLFFSQQKKMMVTKQKLNTCTFNLVKNQLEAKRKENTKTEEYRETLKNLGEKIETVEKKYKESFDKLGKKFEQQFEKKNKTIAEQAASLKKLNEKIKRMCLSKKIVNSDCIEYQELSVKGLEQINSENNEK